jgi:hypothetical protein
VSYENLPLLNNNNESTLEMSQTAPGSAGDSSIGLLLLHKGDKVPMYVHTYVHATSPPPGLYSPIW